MSEVILDTITGKSTATTITIGSTPVVSASANSMTIRGEGSNQTSIQQGLAKQWSYFNMSSTTLLDSLNTTSLTDSGTGKFLVNVANDFSSTNYLVNYTGNAHADDTFNANVTCIAKISYDRSDTAGQYDIICYGGSALADGKYNYVIAHGDLS